MFMKKFVILLLALTLVLCASFAMAATEPNSKTIEETTTYATGSVSVKIDRWCYAFNKTNCRFFVADIVVSDPSQLQTAFAGEKYFTSNAEATSTSRRLLSEKRIILFNIIVRRASPCPSQGGVTRTSREEFIA